MRKKGRQSMAEVLRKRKARAKEHRENTKRLMALGKWLSDDTHRSLIWSKRPYRRFILRDEANRLYYASPDIRLICDAPKMRSLFQPERRRSNSL